MLLLPLILLCTLLSAAAALAEAEEPRYYTWVDAQGVMHNTLITPTESANKNSTKETESRPNLNVDDFPSEKEYQQKLNDRSAEKKPFFTWTDAEGVVRSEVKPDVLVDFVAEEVIYDAVFAPPFRVPSYVKQGQCCQNYSTAFSTTAEFNGSASYQVDDTLFPFQTQSGHVAAGYFSLPKLAAKEIILLKGYKLPKDSAFEIIALDEAYQPLYLATKLNGLFIEQTWKDLAYKKILLEISDVEIKYLIVFVQSGESALSNYRLSVMRDQLLD